MVALPPEAIGTRTFWQGCHPYAGVSDPPIALHKVPKRDADHPENRIRQLGNVVESRDTAITTTESTADVPNSLSRWTQLLPSPSPTLAFETALVAS